MKKIYNFYIILIAVLSSLSAAYAQNQVCNLSEVSLTSQTLVFQDASTKLTFQQVQQLPRDSFHSLDQKKLMQHYSQSAFWLKIKLVNNSNINCQRWLIIGSPRLEDVKLYESRPNGLNVQVAGSKYSIVDWTAQISKPVFSVMFQPHSRSELLIRVSTSLSVILDPKLLSTESLLKSQQDESVRDGLIAGIVLALVIVGLILSMVMKSILLLAQTFSLLSYLVIASLLNGYFVYLPIDFKYLNFIMIACIIISFAFTELYISLLFQVERFRKIVFLGYIALLVLYVLSNFMAYYYPAKGHQYSFEILRGIYPMVLINIVIGIIDRHRFNWMSWLIFSLLALQFFLRYVLKIEDTPWQTTYDIRGLFSVIPGSVILLLTLISIMLENRRHQLKAEKELLDQQQQQQQKLESLVVLRTSQLNESIYEMDLLLARVSHDLRSPLVAVMDIINQLGCIINSDKLDSLKYYANFQLRMIDELLEFSKNKLKTIEIFPAADYLLSFLHGIENEGRYLAKRNNNNFSCLRSNLLPPVAYADFPRLRQIIVNLLDNASKFTKNGEILLCFECIEKNDNDLLLRVSVDDSGIGTNFSDPEILKKPFVRGENASNFNGSGMGLAIVKQLLTLMNSELNIEKKSKLGGGNFWFDLRLMVGSENEVEDCFLEKFQPIPLNGQGYNILVVDDVISSYERISDLLSGYGFDVLTASNGSAAIEIIKEHHISLLITDQEMPGMNGWQLVHYIRDLQPDIKTILYTSYSTEKRDSKDLATFDAILIKPIGSDTLLSLINNLLGLNMEK